MNSDYEKKLEIEIDRELKGLPSLRAPVSLAPRVMAVIERRAALPWYRRSWQAWPLPVQALSMLVLLAVFGGICFGGWQLSHTETFAAVVHRVGGLFAVVGMIFKTLGVLGDSVLLVVKQLSTGWIIACVVAGLLGYAMCLGLGTIYVRVGWRTAQETNL
jgi:hypothetical protein